MAWIKGKARLTHRRFRKGTVFSIGEFSRITGLTIKTLRFYHEQGLLVPTFVDDETGYRFYADSQIETARVISYLRQLDLLLAEIAEILRHVDDETQVLEVMERQRATIEEKLKRLRTVKRSLDQFLTEEKKARQMMAQSSFEVEEKELEPITIAGVRMKGKYSDCGQGFAKIGRRFGRYICGKPLLLHYDTEYKENDADFEVCMPVRGGREVDGISVRQLPGGPSVSLLHQGPYEQLGRSYAKILQYLSEKGYEALTPSREIYHKGPGMIFRGNPKNYLTEIQMLVREKSHAVNKST